MADPSAATGPPPATDTDGGDVPSVFSIGLSLFFVWILLFFSLVRESYAVAVSAAALVLLMHGTRFWSRFSVARLALTFAPDRTRLFPDETLRVRVELDNRKLLPVWLRLEVQTASILQPDEAFEGETRLLPYERVRRDYTLQALYRGVSVIGPARIVAGDLLGLHRRRRRYPIRNEIIVFPRLRELLPLSIPFREYFGIHASKGPVEDPAWYAGTRDYVGNRPARNIHWKASARLGVLQEKLYEPTSHRKVLFVLDCAEFFLDGQMSTVGTVGAGPGHEARDSRPAGCEAAERSIEAAASVAFALMETGASFGFVTDAVTSAPFQSLLPMGRGPEHLGSMLEMLARVDPTNRNDLNPLLREALRGAMGVVYFGARPSSRVRALFSTLGQRGGRLIFVFAGAATGQPTEWIEENRTDDEQSRGHMWLGHPAYLTQEVIDVRAT